MRLVRLLLLPLLALLGGSAIEATRIVPFDSAPQMGGMFDPSSETAADMRCVVRIFSSYGNGMGGLGCGVWTDHGIYTAWHVVDGAEAVTVVAADGSEHRAWGWWRAGPQDAALVRLERPLPFPGLPLATEPLAPGTHPAEALSYYGHGMMQGIGSRIAGRVADALSMGGHTSLGEDFYAFSGPAVVGMSGCPLVSGGKVYGVLSHGTVPPSAAYFAKCDRVSTGAFTPPRRGSAPKSAAKAPRAQDPLLPAPDCVKPGT